MILLPSGYLRPFYGFHEFAVVGAEVSHTNDPEPYEQIAFYISRPRRSSLVVMTDTGRLPAFRSVAGNLLSTAVSITLGAVATE